MKIIIKWILNWHFTRHIMTEKCENTKRRNNKNEKIEKKNQKRNDEEKLRNI